MTVALMSAWTTLCHHCDGIAIATTLEALHRSGALDLLQSGPASPAALAEALDLAPGYAGLAGKLLRSQGFATLRGEELLLTDTGRAVAGEPRLVHGAKERIENAAVLLSALVGAGSAVPSMDLSRFCDPAMAERWRQQALGPLAAAAWFGLDRRGVLGRLREGRYRAADAAEEQAFQILRLVGWIEADGAEHVRVTEPGRSALDLVVQYAYPLCYLPTFASVDALLNGGARLARDGDKETHVDRSLDIAFSGVVFSKSCRVPFLELALPLFDTPVAADQPIAIVDTGSGDGTVLTALFEALCQHTRRGGMLDRYPLVLVGVEVNEVARRATEERLAGLGVPSLAILGDVGQPKRIAEALAASGIDPLRVLHVNKSVIHNRSFRAPSQLYPAPATSAVFVDAAGGSIPQDRLFSNLVDFFSDWALVLGPHGMISIESHTVAPERAAAHEGRNLISLLDAAHGYSGQFLVEIDFHRQAQDLAGIARLRQRDLGTAMVGTPIMSVDHLIRR